MPDPGDRVYAIRNIANGVCHFFGFGVYDGDFERDQGVGGFNPPALRGFPNPRITLDNGKIVWGCECWWGPESEFERGTKGMRIQNVDPEEFRAVSKGKYN